MIEKTEEKAVAVKIVYCNGAINKDDIEYHDLKVIFLMKKGFERLIKKYLDSLGYESDGRFAYIRKDRSDFSFMYLKYVYITIN